VGWWRRLELENENRKVREGNWRRIGGRKLY
jgi:hypothetical protein